MQRFLRSYFKTLSIGPPALQPDAQATEPQVAVIGWASVSPTSRYLEPNIVSIEFTSLKLYDFTPDFPNPRFLETSDNSNQFSLQWDVGQIDTQ